MKRKHGVRHSSRQPRRPATPGTTRPDAAKASAMKLRLSRGRSVQEQVGVAAGDQVREVEPQERTRGWPRGCLRPEYASSIQAEPLDQVEIPGAVAARDRARAVPGGSGRAARRSSRRRWRRAGADRSWGRLRTASPTGNRTPERSNSAARVELVAGARVDTVEQAGLLGERMAEDAHVGLGVVGCRCLAVDEVLDAADHEVGTGRDGAPVHALEHRGCDDVVAVDEREVGAPSVLHAEVAGIPQPAVGLRERPDEPGEPGGVARR